MLSREEALARAEALVRALLDEVEQMRPSDYLPWQGRETRGLARPLADALLLAQAEARSTFEGAPLTPETLAEVRTRTEADVKEGYVAGRFTASVADRRALLAHVAYLESLLGDLREDGALDPCLKGRRAGRAEAEAEAAGVRHAAYDLVDAIVLHEPCSSALPALGPEAHWYSASVATEVIAALEEALGPREEDAEAPDPQEAAP